MRLTLTIAVGLIMLALAGCSTASEDDLSDAFVLALQAARADERIWSDGPSLHPLLVDWPRGPLTGGMPEHYQDAPFRLDEFLPDEPTCEIDEFYACVDWPFVQIADPRFVTEDSLQIHLKRMVRLPEESRWYRATLTRRDGSWRLASITNAGSAD
jgi:hypothetical protein